MWNVYTDKNFDKKLHKIRSNKEVRDKCRIAMLELVNSPHPEMLGDRKRGHLRHLYGYRLTRSYRMLYSVDYNEEAIILVDLDDHKNIYGKD